MVPIKEMTDCLKVVRESAVLKPKSWVRLKRGIFKDDLAQVDYVESAQNAVHLKMLPRIDYSRPRGLLRNSQSVCIICIESFSFITLTSTLHRSDAFIVYFETVFTFLSWGRHGPAVSLYWIVINGLPVRVELWTPSWSHVYCHGLVLVDSRNAIDGDLISVIASFIIKLK